MIDPSLVCHGQRCTLGSVGHLRQHSFASALQPHRLVARRSVVTTQASVQARPASIELKTFDGNVSGTQELALQVAGNHSAKGLVHRYLVTVRQNARAVCSFPPKTHSHAHAMLAYSTLAVQVPCCFELCFLKLITLNQHALLTCFCTHSPYITHHRILKP